MVFNMNYAPSEKDIAMTGLAKSTMMKNDLGGYTVPTHGLYPFQWNWDSAIVALGWLTFDEKRAWEEVTSLLSAQWDNGMVPHIVFHRPSQTYFPGPDIWGSRNEIASTSISQPPVLATVVRKLVEEGNDQDLIKSNLESVLPALIRYHLWWYHCRDPENIGLVVSYHPWESGMDNSPSWDDALAAVPEVKWEYTRRDTNHIDSSQRPHKSEYDRFLYLVDVFKNLDFDDQAIYQQCPYQMNDVGIISILHRASADLLWLCDAVGLRSDDTHELKERMALTQDAIHVLWNDTTNMFHSCNRLTGQMSAPRVTGGLLPLFAGLATETQARQMEPVIADWVQASPYALASTHPHDPNFEPQRYWRGPVWIHINWMIALGLEDYDLAHLSEKIRSSSRDLVYHSGYNESFHAVNGEQSGGSEFSWTAAMALYWLL